MKLRFHTTLIIIASIFGSCTKVDNTIANIEEIIALKTRNIQTYTIYANIAAKDSAINECNIMKMLILSEKIQLDSCKKLYSKLKKKPKPDAKQTDSTVITNNTAENLYRILIDKQLEGYNILPSMTATTKSAKANKFAPLLLKLINVNQLNADELHKLLNNNNKQIDSIHKINIITNF